MEPILELHGIVKHFPGVTALDSVDLVVAPGEIHALVGQNGAGKSALIKILSGAYTADAGEMRLAGAPYSPRTPLDALEAGIRVVYQEFNQLPYLSVAENLLFERLPRRYGVMLDRALLTRRALSISVLRSGNWSKLPRLSRPPGGCLCSTSQPLRSPRVK
jgi:ribose transport system ATP-binding protein